MLLIWHNHPLLAVPLQQVPLQIVAAEEEIASSRLSLDKEIDRFHFDEREGVLKRPVQLLDSETESDRLSAAHSLKLIVTQVTNSSEEEKEGMDLKQRNGLNDLLANRNEGSTSKESPKTNFPPIFLLLLFPSSLPTSD